MDINDYQDAARKTAVYAENCTTDAECINYTVLGLLGEAGELANKWKKYYRDNLDLYEVKKTMASELGDVFWYLVNLAWELDMPADLILEHNLAKLQSRQQRGMIGGSGDDR